MRNPIRMKVLVVGIGLVLMVALGAQAQQPVPLMMSYQGVLSANGTHYNGTGYFKFALVSADGLTVYWSSDPTFGTPVPVSNGLFSVMLGDTMLPHMFDIPPSTFEAGADAHLRIWFGETEDGAFEQLTPDQPLGSAGYAMMAAKVGIGAVGMDQLVNGSVIRNKIEDNAVNASKLADNAVTAAKIADGVITSNKIDWSTMPVAFRPLGYKENGSFATAPVASGANAIAMGFGATASGMNATVGGGDRNTASAEWATVGGGYTNVAGGERSTVAGGIRNFANGFTASIGGGSDNAAAAEWAVIGGGSGNAVAADYGVIGGGRDNDIANSSSDATVGGGSDNNIGTNAERSTIGGGYANAISNNSQSATVAGGSGNEIGANGVNSTISGGGGNAIGNSSSYATVAGGSANGIGSNALYSAIGGGWGNFLNDSWGATVAGGYNNSIGPGAHYSVIGGGWTIRIKYSGYATVAGGVNNSIGSNSSYSAIGGGSGNEIGTNAKFSAIGGGFNNGIGTNAHYVTIAGGSDNDVGDNASYAFAAGRRAKANHTGAFVWGDAQDADFASRGTNQFLVRASGGVGINTSDPGVHGGAMLAIATPATSVPAIRLLGPVGFYNYGARLSFGDAENALIEEDLDDKLKIQASRIAMMWGNVGINTDNPSYRLHVDGTAGKPGGGTWTDASDGRLKKDAQPLAGALARLTQLRGVSFEWINPAQHGRATGEREAGLIAQEVEAVFPEWVAQAPASGADAALLDGDGRMKTLTFPHGFNAYVVEAFKELQAENRVLKQANDDMKARLKRLEALLAR